MPLFDQKKLALRKFKAFYSQSQHPPLQPGPESLKKVRMMSIQGTSNPELKAEISLTTDYTDNCKSFTDSVPLGAAPLWMLLQAMLFGPHHNTVAVSTKFRVLMERMNSDDDLHLNSF